LCKYYFHVLPQVIEQRFIGILRRDGDEPLIEFGPLFFDFDRGGD
jgi:hypothetical protein